MKIVHDGGDGGGGIDILAEAELNKDYGNKLRYFKEVFAKFVFRSD